MQILRSQLQQELLRPPIQQQARHLLVETLIVEQFDRQSKGRFVRLGNLLVSDEPRGRDEETRQIESEETDRWTLPHCCQPDKDT